MRKALLALTFVGMAASMGVMLYMSFTGIHLSYVDYGIFVGISVGLGVLAGKITRGVKR